MKSYKIIKSIIIGTAQLGTNYGIANQEKSINIENKINFLNFAFNNGFNHFDTAYSYVNSHKILGEWIKKYNTNPFLSSKLPKLHLYDNDAETLLKNMLKDLNINKINTLLLHNPEDWNNDKIALNIDKMILNNLISNFGLSIYEEKHIIYHDLIKVLQIPGNIFSQEILTSDRLRKFIDIGGNVQIRSIFAQGLLLMDLEKIPVKFEEIKKGIIHFSNIAKELNINKAALAIICIKYLSPMSNIVIGFDNINQLKQIINIDKINIGESDIKEILKITKKYNNKLWDPRIW